MNSIRLIITATFLMPALSLAASHDLATFVEEYDLDGNGSVSKEEFQEGRVKRFAATDVNNDEGVSHDEYAEEFRTRLVEKNPEPAVLERQMKQTDVRFKVLDSNKDGRLSFAEYSYSGWRMYGEHDYNRDGAVSMDDKTDDKAGEKSKRDPA